MHNRFYRFAIASLLVLVVAACGFRLRGQAQLPPAMAITYIKTSRSELALPSPLGEALSRALEANGVQVTTDPETATAVLEILNEKIQRRTLAAGRDDQVRQNILTYNVDYRITRADGSELIPRQQIGTSQDLIYREADILGRAEGEDLALRDMVSNLSTSIIRRLQVVANQ